MQLLNHHLLKMFLLSKTHKKANIYCFTTYQERYFVCGGKNWKANNSIWFYTGNEADVELYINNTGLMWENSDNFDSIMVFAEHRYFGQSLPFDSNTQDMDNRYLVFLNTDQALADYAFLIQTLKTQWNSWNSPVIGISFFNNITLNFEKKKKRFRWIIWWHVVCVVSNQMYVRTKVFVCFFFFPMEK
ncbi:hypothetical protein RFI_04074 [Reticulomyxa filosa]|uniref:Uncharacterized protein n=1 Tax=Reticulomyxa filosa TaxID=46433 RepID=X6P5Y8_RETFI|nr:hypothetical protein RFI_04074 [Reticulomyxa filosa]|eukprot:ETO33032.1 hypothetical protein RFI_04074 [Reticulomyxa filosa]